MINVYKHREEQFLFVFLNLVQFIPCLKEAEWPENDNVSFLKMIYLVMGYHLVRKRPRIKALKSE